MKLEELRARAEEIKARLRALDAEAGDGDLDEQQAEEWRQLETELESVKSEIADSGCIERGVPEGPFPFPRQAVRGDGSRHPLEFDPRAVAAIDAALKARTDARVFADGFGIESRAALTTSAYGAPRAWGANVLPGPRLLHRVAGVPRQQVDAVVAQIPNLTLPTSQSGVAEGASLPEYAASTTGNVTLARFGRFTDLSRESLVGTSTDAILSMHQIGIAKDLDDVLVTATESAAGTPITFDADVSGNVRFAMAQVIDNTAASEDASDLVVIANPADVKLLQDVQPISGSTIGEGFGRFSGAVVYATSAATAGIVTVANLRAGARYFEARGTVTELDADVKTGVLTVATSVIAGYGLGLTTGFAVSVDVVSS